ncbi:AAA family ATPase [Pseudokordiimonas caeni]|uniref:AAA family ATPase n=1 Tax=Pseudokordiimonas caeni TaxID=2997908 RepID=UPI0028110077|nr:cellulose synthase operon protein YhjQ/BcsQ [Pseudokordiimonas caeni]
MQKAGNKKAALEREQFGAWVCDDLTGKLLAPIAGEQGLAVDMIFGGGIAGAVRALGAMPVPEFLIVDLSESVDPRADMQALAEVCQQETMVLALGTLNDVTLYRDLIGAGVHDYLVKPLDPAQLRDAVVSALNALAVAEEEPVHAQKAPGDKHQIVVIGVRGGLGASTIAANLAWDRARGGEQTVLLDMDLYFGVSALLFDLEPGRGLADALENPSRVDGLFLERAVVKPIDNLSILGTEAPVGSLREPDAGALDHLVKALSENYRTVVVDLPRGALADHSDILHSATDIVLVTDFSLRSARDCIRLMSHIKSVKPDATVHVVASMTVPGQNEVEEKDFETSIEAPVVISIPLDAKGLLMASRKGTVIMDAVPGSKMSQALAALSRRFDAGMDSGKGKKASWIGKLLKR